MNESHIQLHLTPPQLQIIGHFAARWSFFETEMDFTISALGALVENDKTMPHRFAERIKRWKKLASAAYSEPALTAAHAKFKSKRPAAYPQTLEDLWVAGAVHVALQLQRAHQTLSKNKGHTILIFDENKVKADKLNEVLFAPPDWIESYYGKKKKQEPLDQIIDSAFFTKSHHAGLAQVADLFAFVFRRYAELTDYGMQPEYNDEPNDIQGLVDRLVPRLLPKAHRWPTQKKCEFAMTFSNMAPSCLLSIGSDKGS